MKRGTTSTRYGLAAEPLRRTGLALPRCIRRAGGRLPGQWPFGVPLREVFTDEPPPSCTNRRLSAGVYAGYWFPSLR
jgi:hypothetical protein